MGYHKRRASKLFYQRNTTENEGQPKENESFNVLQLKESLRLEMKAKEELEKSLQSLIKAKKKVESDAANLKKLNERLVKEAFLFKKENKLLKEDFSNRMRNNNVQDSDADFIQRCHSLGKKTSETVDGLCPELSDKLQEKKLAEDKVKLSDLEQRLGDSMEKEEPPKRSFIEKIFTRLKATIAAVSYGALQLLQYFSNFKLLSETP